MNRLMSLIIVAAGTIALVGCSTMSGMSRPDARADVRNADGAVVGEALIYQRGGDLEVRLGVTNLAAGTYGTHIHMVGQCEAPKFTSAGGHWNPMGRQHGLESAMGPHSGDLPNIVTNVSGSGTLTFRVPAQAVSGPGGIIDADGGAIVIHAKADDMRTDPSGSSGDRIACGIFRQL